MITNPDSLSKERLKTELKKRGIRCNSNENKGYYVDLYREKVMRENYEHQRSEFSSDDEAKHSPRVSPKKTLLGRKSGKLNLQHVQNLTDKELKEELIQIGEDPGPINPTTRGVYERKLAKLLGEKQSVKASPQKSLEPVKDKEDSFVAQAEWSDEEEIGGETEDKGRSYNLRSRKREAPPSTEVQLSSGANIPDTSSKQTSHSPKPSPKKSPARNTPEGYRLFCNLLLFLSVFLVVFLLYEHFTIPEGKKSLFTCAYETIRDTFINLAPPAIARQEAPKDESPPPDRDDAPPLPDPRGDPPLPVEKDDPPSPEVSDTSGDDLPVEIPTPPASQDSTPQEEETPAPQEKDDPTPQEKETPAPQEETPAPPQEKETPAPPQEEETPTPPQEEETPAPQEKETPAPPQEEETPAPQEKETPAPPQEKETPTPPQEKETPTPQEKETPAPPQEKETPAPPQEKETPAPQEDDPTPQEKETPAPPQEETPAPPQEKETPTPPQEETPAPQERP